MGCVIVTFNSAGQIIDCLQSLSLAKGVRLHIVVVDNGSRDDTIERVYSWVEDHDLQVEILETGKNSGFAAGVNIGLKWLCENPVLDRFWVLNPDCIVPSTTPVALAKAALPFSLLGGRIMYDGPRDSIQIDGGRINRWTGATQNINIGKPAIETPLPEAVDLDFISGASMVASRAFLELAGPMPEHYFLYYEEVDWAQCREHLPMKVCDQAQVFHSAGASIGSPTLSRGPSQVSAYFKHRARMRFMAIYHPKRLPIAYLFGWGKLVQHLLRGQVSVAPAILRALHGLPPGKSVASAISTSG